ncbi:hypothetical protein [Paenibacillus hamazuiensis]|uniref:hypothetical protein n=1 Tax=Paenibacillus hamazuiensis TaxID=2936508 RepID=UPI0020103BEE|nr:hypothetical protein [Paenibacillus hamazuiensis]
MNKVFVEYKVKTEERQRFLSWAERLTASEKRVSVYEGADQPNLFVELWENIDYAEYEEMKAQRTGDAAQVSRFSDLTALSDFVEGGKAKIHIWYFRKVK